MPGTAKCLTHLSASTMRPSIALRLYPQIHAVLLQGITFAGFNVIDLAGLHAALGVPVPEPLRVAHMIAGGVTRGESSGRA